MICFKILSIVHWCRYIPNGCEIDVNIPEDFSPDDLLKFINAFINVCTVYNRQNFCQVLSVCAWIFICRMKLGPTLLLWLVLTLSLWRGRVWSHRSLTWCATGWEGGPIFLFPCSIRISFSTSGGRCSGHTRSKLHLSCDWFWNLNHEQ